MKKTLSAVTSAITITVLLSSCATIAGHSKYPVTITSVPEKASVKITDKKGNQVYTGETPATVELKSGSGYFSKQIYSVDVTKAGYQHETVQIRPELSAWYIANIAFGGLIGLLIVDPLTGAMYKIDPRNIDVTLEKKSGKSAMVQPLPKEQAFERSISINDVPKEALPYLVRVN